MDPSNGEKWKTKENRATISKTSATIEREKGVGRMETVLKNKTHTTFPGVKLDRRQVDVSVVLQL